MPAISFGDGNDLVNGGVARGEALGKEYVDKHYHQPSDEWSTAWDFTGMVQDVQLLHNSAATSPIRAFGRTGVRQRIPRRSRPFGRRTWRRSAVRPGNATAHQGRAR